MNRINESLTRIQDELSKLKDLGIDVSNLEKEVYELSIPEDIEFKNKMFLRQCNDPSIPEGPSTTYGLFLNIMDEEPQVYISLNSKEDSNLDLVHNELNIWTEDEGLLYNKYIDFDYNDEESD